MCCELNTEFTGEVYLLHRGSMTTKHLRTEDTCNYSLIDTVRMSIAAEVFFTTIHQGWRAMKKCISHRQ